MNFLNDAVDRIVARLGKLHEKRPRAPDPMMGVLTRDEWMIWAYRHADHHLRQFAL